MKLFGHPLSSCTRKVLFALGEKGASVDLVTVDLFTGAHKEATHLARHPFGVIPVLDDDGFVLYESRAILRYVDARLPGTSLVPASVRDRARMDQWLSVDQSYVGPHTRTLAQQRIVRKHAGLAPDAAVTAAAEAALGDALRVIDRELAGRRHLAGDALSLADISLAPYVASLPMIEAGHLVRELEHLSAWYAAIAARPTWMRVLG